MSEEMVGLGDAFQKGYLKGLEDQTKENQSIDNVNHPPHYNSSKAKCPGCDRRIECIDITRYMNFNIGNAFKYLWRAELKGGKEDLQKAIWYIQNEIDKI